MRASQEINLAFVLVQFNQKLEQLKKNSTFELDEDPYWVARKMYLKLSRTFRGYLRSERSPEQLIGFQEEWACTLKEAKPVLSVHRGWKDFFAKSALCLSTGYQGPHFFSKPFTKTNSLQRLDELQHRAEAMIPLSA